MERELLQSGHAIRVVEDCLNGRRTVFDDPYKPGRNGLVGLEQRIEVSSPLELVILMLGTNDFQSMHAHNAWHSAQGMAALVDAVRRAPIEPGMRVPEVLIVAPPATTDPKGSIAPKFEGAREKSMGLADAFRQVAQDRRCDFFDAGGVVSTSAIDGVHLDAEQHQTLGIAMAGAVLPALKMVDA